MLSKNCIACGNEFTKPINESLKNWENRHKFCSVECGNDWRKGKRFSPKTEFGNRKYTPWLKGTKGIAKPNSGSFQKGDKLSESTKQKMKGRIPWNKGKEFEAIKGSKHHNWKGGITSENRKIRHSVKYKLWRTAVFERDNYQCVIGGKEHGNKLHADHIKSFSEYPELRFVVSNGRTLCIDCHKQTDSFLNNKEGKNQFS